MYPLNGNDKNGWLALVFAPILLFSVGMFVHSAFAMGAAPSTCPNRYDGPITSFIINNGSQTFDAIANPGVTFNADTFGTYNVTFVIHTPSQSSQGNSDSGTTWYDSDAIGFANGVCVYGVGPDQDVTISKSWGLASQVSRYHDSTGSYSFTTGVTRWPGVHYVVDWIYPNAVAPDAPANLSATAVSSSQINLSWNIPSNDGGAYITGYKIERSTDGGTHWSTIVENTGTTTPKYVCDNGACHYMTTYSDTGLASDTTYTYQVSSINRIGAGSPSNTASTTTLAVLSVKSVDALGNPITGIWMELHSANGSTIASGYTPINFDVFQGTQYAVYATNYLNYIFVHWEDGSTNPSRNTTPTTSHILTATYTP